MAWFTIRAIFRGFIVFRFCTKSLASVGLAQACPNELTTMQNIMLFRRSFTEFNFKRLNLFETIFCDPDPVDRSCLYFAHFTICIDISHTL